MAGVSSFLAWGTNGGNAFNANNTLPIAGGGLGGLTTTTDAEVQTTFNSACTLSLLGGYIRSQLAPTPVHTRINGINGNQTLTAPSPGPTFVQDTTHTDSVAPGDLLNFQGGSTSAVTTIVYLEMQQHSPRQNTVYVMGGLGASGGPTISTSAQYAPIMGGGSVGGFTTESYLGNVPLEAPGVLSNMQINMLTASSGTVTAIFRHNGANGNQALSIPPSTTGITQDTTHTDSIVAGDVVDTVYSSTNASGNWNVIAYEFVGSGPGHDTGTFCLNGSGGSPMYTALIGSNINYDPPGEAGYAAALVLYSATASRLRIGTLQGLAMTGTTTFRHNLANGNQVVTLTSSVGPAIDTTHTDSLVAGDTWDASLTVSGVQQGCALVVLNVPLANQAQPLVSTI